MATKDELTAYVHNTFSVDDWTVQEGTVVPFPKDVPLNNTAKHFNLATFLYADLNGSTKMVEQLTWMKSAEVYKTYLYCASRLIRHFDGEIVAFDGDRVMGVFLGVDQATNAVKCALRINWAVIHIIQPLYKKQYTDGFKVGHTIGIDASETRCCRTGVRGDNDLVWVASAANAAAKLTSLGLGGPIWITDIIHDCMSQEVTLYTTGANLWSQWTWNAMNKRRIYNSDWWWSL